MTCGALILALVGAGTLVAAQVPTSPPAPAFEVASVKPNVSGDTRSTYSGPPGGSIVITNMMLRNLIIEAYGIRANVARFLMAGGNERILRTRFDVNARAPVDTPRAEQRLMLRTLLANRFNLRTHAESRQVPVYALTVAREARLGPSFARRA